MGAANFVVEVDGVEVGCCAVLGLGLEAREQQVSPVVLRRSAGADLTLWRWAREPRARTVAVTLLDAARTPVCRYLLSAATPERWSGPSLDALAGAVALEELVLTAERLEVESLR